MIEKIREQLDERIDLVHKQIDTIDTDLTEAKGYLQQACAQNDVFRYGQGALATPVQRIARLEHCRQEELGKLDAYRNIQAFIEALIYENENTH